LGIFFWGGGKIEKKNSGGKVEKKIWGAKPKRKKKYK
jgi:hypothetical protein